MRTLSRSTPPRPRSTGSRSTEALSLMWPDSSSPEVPEGRGAVEASGSRADRKTTSWCALVARSGTPARLPPSARADCLAHLCIAHLRPAVDRVDPGHGGRRRVDADTLSVPWCRKRVDCVDLADFRLRRVAGKKHLLTQTMGIRRTTPGCQVCLQLRGGDLKQEREHPPFALFPEAFHGGSHSSQ